MLSTPYSLLTLGAEAQPITELETAALLLCPVSIPWTHTYSCGGCVCSVLL